MLRCRNLGAPMPEIDPQETSVVRAAASVRTNTANVARTADAVCSEPDPVALAALASVHNQGDRGAACNVK